MAILVSGGAGYIGSHTCIELLNAGYDVVVADNYYNASPVVLDRVKQITGKDFRFYQASVDDVAREGEGLRAGAALRADGLEPVRALFDDVGPPSTSSVCSSINAPAPGSTTTIRSSSA